MRTFTPIDWIENFRVSKDTFYYLCQELRYVIGRQDTQLRKAVSVEQRVAITLWCLATCSEYRTIGHLFGLARSTVCRILHDTCNAIVSKMQRMYIEFPLGEERQKVIKGFESTWGMIQCVGSIDGCHIPIMPPALNHTDYFNRKGWYSIILQAIVDHEYLFRDICVGWPGSVHDARVYANSAIFKKIRDENVLDGDTRIIQGKDIPIFLIGDSAYPLTKHLMKPFSFNTSLTAAQKTFNYRLSKARIVAENAFGRLKARWRRLTKRCDMNVCNVPHIVAAACILHNMCEIHGDKINDAWLESVETLEQPPTSSTPDTSSLTDAKLMRNMLVEYLT